MGNSSLVLIFMAEIVDIRIMAKASGGHLLENRIGVGIAAWRG